MRRDKAVRDNTHVHINAQRNPSDVCLIVCRRGGTVAAGPSRCNHQISYSLSLSFSLPSASPQTALFIRVVV